MQKSFWQSGHTPTLLSLLANFFLTYLLLVQ